MLSFKEAEFPLNSKFQPTPEVLNYWLYTKKKPSSGGHLTLPGLFQTAEYSTQMLAFFAILVLELVPTIYGIDEGVLWQAIVAAIFIDIFLAIVSHLWHDKICLNRNLLVVATSPDQKEGIKRIIATHKGYTNFFYFLIIISGCLKFYFFFDAYMVIDAIAGGVLVCYLLGALLHISYTGYFLYTSRFNYLFYTEFNKFSKQHTVEDAKASDKYAISIDNSPYRTIDTGGQNVQLEKGDYHGHKIEPKGDTSYSFITSGVLTDKDLSELLNRQNGDTNKTYVAKTGLKLQLESIGVISPSRQEATSSNQ